jgi:hypothetical protein
LARAVNTGIARLRHDEEGKLRSLQ